MLSLRCLALVLFLATFAKCYICPDWMPAFSWSRWMVHGDCSLLCGGEGFVEQYRRRRVCSPHDIVFESQLRNGTCHTSSCGNWCPLGVNRFLPHSSNPSRFYQCSGGKAFLHRCPPKTVWGQALGRCAWPSEVK